MASRWDLLTAHQIRITDGIIIFQTEHDELILPVDVSSRRVMQTENVDMSDTSPILSVTTETHSWRHLTLTQGTPDSNDICHGLTSLAIIVNSGPWSCLLVTLSSRGHGD